MTKNNTNKGAVHLSRRSISSWEISLMLQKIVPSIIQVKSDEKPMCTPPTSNFKRDMPTVRKTNATDTDKRFEREWKNLSTKENKKPIAAPSANESTISMRGSTKMDMTLMLPEIKAFATPKDTAKSTSPTASSRATTGSKVLVRGPFALY